MLDLEGISELMSDIHRGIANPLAVIFGDHTLNRVLMIEVDLALRKTIEAVGHLAVTQIESPTCCLGLLYTRLEIACALQVVFTFLSEFGLAPGESRRLFLEIGRLGSELMSGSSDLVSTLDARVQRIVVLTGLVSGGHVHCSADALAPKQRVCARQSWTIARRAEHIVSGRRL